MKLIIVLFFFPSDIQECYEVTLQLNTEQTVVKEDSRQDVWEVIFTDSCYRLWRKSAMFLMYVVSHALSPRFAS